MPLIPETYDFNAGDTVSLVFTPSGDLSSFTGWTCTVTVRDDRDQPVVNAGACTVASDGSTATYQAKATDFPRAGVYTASLRSTQGALAYTADQVVYKVGPA